jgi:hypothetical protein
MSDSDGGSPVQVLLIVALLAGGGYYFFNHYQVGGLDGVSISSKDQSPDNDYYDESFVSYRDAPIMIGPSQSLTANTNAGQLTTTAPVSAPGTYSSIASGFQSNTSGRPTLARSVAQSPHRPAYRPIKIASWALDGFGPTKLASADARNFVSKVVRRYDVIALQQIASIERDLVPRLIDVINGTEHRYDYVMGSATGPRGRQEQLAFLFDTTTVLVDRTQTYTVSDPAEELTYDPMVASFRAAEPPSTKAWTFSIVNVRIDLSKAATEVALLPSIITSVRRDGRGEDDVIVMGLLQADDAYLLPTVGENAFHAAVRHRSTDVFSRFQTSNILIDRDATSEYLGRGGVFDYRRNYDLNPIEAEAVTSHLPAFAEFTAHEGGEL